MKSAVIRESLQTCLPFMLALAASESHFSYSYREISRLIFTLYNTIFLYFGFFEKFRSLLKTEEHLPTKIAFGVILFYAIAVIRDILYGIVETQNHLSVIRCFIVLTFLAFHNRALMREMICTFVCFVTVDTVLSITFFDDYADKTDARDKQSMLVFRVVLLLMVSFPYLLEYILQYYTFTLFNGSSEGYQRVRRMDDGLCERVFEKTLEQEKELFDTIRRTYTVADTVKEILSLATLLELFRMLTKHNYANDKIEYIEEQTYTDFVRYRAALLLKYNSDYKLNSLIYFLLQPFMKFGTISYAILDEISYFVIVIWDITYQTIVKQFQVCWKIALYMITLVLNAVVFCLIVQTLYNYSEQLVEHSLQHLRYIQVDIGSCHDTVHRSAGIIQIGQFSLYERYLGEDVSFCCWRRYRSTIARRSQKYQVTWTHNGIAFDSSTSDRVNISVTYYEWYVESKLILLLIDENDFGEFRCIFLEENYEYIPLLNTYLGNGYIGTMLFKMVVYNRHYHIQHYLLRQQTKSKHTYEIVEGSFVVFDIPAYISFAEFNDISILYTVNGLEIEDICRRDWMSCFLLALIKKNFIQERSSRVFLYLGYNNLYSLTLRVCACSKLFGVHKLVIYRDYYNRTTGKIESIEIEYPIDFYFLPKGNETGIKKGLFINNTREFIGRYLDNNDHIVIPITPGIKLRVSVYSVFNCISVVLYTIFICYVLKLANYVLYLYCCLTVIPFKNLLLFGTFRRPLLPLEARTFAGIIDYQEQMYDVYISHSENDYAFAKHIILPYIEHECGQEVCFPHRDLAHEAGSTLLHLYIKATQESRKFIVVLSRSYLEDTDCNGLQLMTCILPLIRERRDVENDLLIIVIEKQIDLPVQIRRDTRISIIDWTRTNDERHNLRKIKHWLSETH